MKRFHEFNVKKISGFVKKNLLMVLFVLFICVGVGVSAYLESDVADIENQWSAVPYSPTTPTPTFIPDTGWWSTVATPTPKK